MKLTLLALSILAIVPIAYGQSTKDSSTPKATPLVSVTAKGTDVRTILGDMFEQAKIQYVLQPSIHYALFLSLDHVDLERGLDIVCAQANLEFDVQDGIYFVHTAHKHVAPKPANTSKPANSSVSSTHPQALAKKGPLPVSVLNRRLTTRLLKTDIRAVFADMGKQTNVKIEISPDVPNYKIDAVLLNTSLKYALGEVTKAANLEYRFTNNQTIEIVKPEESHVALVK